MSLFFQLFHAFQTRQCFLPSLTSFVLLYPHLMDNNSPDNRETHVVTSVYDDYQHKVTRPARAKVTNTSGDAEI